MKRFTSIITAMILSATGFTYGTTHFNEGMELILKQYLVIHQSLMGGEKTNIITDAANAIITQAKKLDPTAMKGKHASHYKNIPTNLIASATKLIPVKSVAEARKIFQMLSQPMAMWVGMAKPKGYTVKFCSMAKASWVQKGTKTMNPYYGQGHKMSGCGQTI